MTPNFHLYIGSPRYILGFHGCDESVAQKLLQETPTFKQSDNLYDWLGNGMYFWENDPNRAWDFVHEAKKRDEIKEKDVYKYPNPTVIGAVLDLGHCLDLTENHYRKLLKDTYQKYKKFTQETKAEMPQNKKAYDGDHDKLLRPLDRAVIEFLHATNIDTQVFDSVRGMFVEGKELYEGAGFHEKTHVQIAIRNPQMIKGYFRVISEHKEAK